MYVHVCTHVCVHMTYICTMMYVCMCATQCIAGIYERMDTEEIQEGLKQMPFFIAYEACPSDSGKIHSSVKSRFLNNDPVVLAAVEQWKKLTDDSKVAIKTRDVDEFRKLMDQNFNLRRELYGDACVGTSNLRMIEIARSLGCSAKFPGSGGAIVGLARTRKDFIQLRIAFEEEDFVFVPLRPYFPNENLL
jgi:glucuronokinase